MRKVLFILNNLGGGGAERVFVNIANVFAANNITVEFLVGKKEGVYLDALHPSIPVIEAGGTSLLKYLTTFPRIFSKNNYTHIFTASDYTSCAAIISKKTTGIPGKIYLTHHYTFPESRPLKHLPGDTISKFIHFFITPHAYKIIAVSKGSLEWLRKFSHHKLQQGSFIYNPVFDDTIYSLATEHVNFPVKITDKIVLLSVGRLAEEKDHLTLIKAFCVLKQTYANAILFILGTGVLQSMLEDYIKKNNLSACVFLMGFDPNPYKWMAKCDVLISSSASEGFGNALVEAMALGKTIVSTNCPSGPAEILQNGAFGYLCPVKDPVKMAKSIVKAIRTPIDQNILKKAATRFKINEIVKKYNEIL